MNASREITLARWKRIEEIFHQATALTGPARETLARKLCGDDAALLQEILNMLRAYDSESAPQPEETESPTTNGPLAGRRIGNYRLEKLLGQGGMGAVYLARRADGEFEQSAALKLMSSHLGDEFFTDRFRQERQILADLDHPNITRLLDGGVSSDGDPYLVMEYVDGEPIDKYCDRLKMSVADRIRLFIEVCGAVAYAHQRQVIHRDLKPANLLVNRQGAPKLLDFGTAKLLSGRNAASTTTRFGMMTLRYASTEQLRGEAATESSDVYSLGVILYELVTGAWPFGEPDSLLAGLERAVLEVEPHPPVKALTEEGAAKRAATRQIRGDLSKVLLKAIQAVPADRYNSVQDFAEDLKRYLAGEPVKLPGYGRVLLKARRTRVAAAIGLLAGVAAAYAVWRYEARLQVAGMNPPENSLVVLPFINANADGRDQYLIDGLTEDLTDELSRNRLLLVIARSSALRFKGSKTDLEDIGRQLNVACVLDGNVERSGDRMKVTARLEKTSGGAPIWTQTFEREPREFMQLEEEVAAAASAALKAGAGAPQSDRYVVKDEAYDLVARANFEFQKYNGPAYDKAEQYLQRAIEIDPGYAKAYALLGTVYNNRGNVNGSAIRTEQERKRAAELWEKALALQPDFRTPRSLLAGYVMQYEWDWARAERELRRTLAQGSDLNAETNYAFLLLYQNRKAEAERHIRLARELDPGMTTLANGALFWFQAGDFEKSLELSREMKTASSAIIYSSMAYIGMGRPDLALAGLKDADDKNLTARFIKAWAKGTLGQREEALALIHPTEALYPDLPVPRQWFALTYASIGDTANAVKWLNRSADAREWQVLNIAVHPSYKKMRNDPGFRALKHRMGLE